MKRSKKGTTDKDLLLYLKSNIKSCCGLAILEELVANPDTSIHCTRLRHLHNPASVHAPEFDITELALPGYIKTNHSIPELPVEFADSKAVNQVKQAYLRVLESEKQARQDNDLAVVEDCRDEREKLEDYLHKAVSRKGRIRYLQNQAHDDYRVVRSNLMNMLKKVRALNQDYADYIKARLVMGYYFMWRSK